MLLLDRVLALLTETLREISRFVKVYILYRRTQ